MEIYSVKINGLHNPLGYLYDTLLCSWKVRGALGERQKSATIKVALDSGFSDIVYVASGADLDSLGVPLDIGLLPYTRYYYYIEVTSDADETVRSDVCWFETAKLNEPWTADWVGIDDGEDIHPKFSREFKTAKAIKQARLYICGLGLFEAYINDVKVGDDLLAPFINDYFEHIQYCSYDVSGLLKGDNKVDVLLGKGWYLGRFGQTGAKYPERRFGLIAELHINYDDGSKEVIKTDDNWNYQKSFLELTDIYDGETQNYLQYSTGNKITKNAKVFDASIKLVERYSPPLHEMEELRVKELINTPDGEIVLDFGQNFSGYVECKQAIPSGKTLTMEFGEVLQNGNFYNENYRTAKSLFTYISDGASRLIRPHFTFFGFRYVRISGLESVDVGSFIGKAVYSNMDATAFFESGNEKINRLHENTVWGLKSNFLDMPTDCPQRDERLAWTGDANVFCRTAGYLMDTRAFYSKYMRDLHSDQLRNDGKVAIFLPNEYLGRTSAVWSDIATFLPMMMYEYYGSKELLAENYPMMKGWVDSVRREDQSRGERYLWDFGFHFGDWVALDGATEQSRIGRTDRGFLASIYYYASVKYVFEAAEILGYGDASEYGDLAKKIRHAILDEYFTPSGRLAIDTQTGYLLALKFGVYHDRERVIDEYKMRVKKDCFLMKGGFVGATMQNIVLAENEMLDIAYDFLFFEDFPGWLYAVNLGATTIWERWNSILPDGTISGTGMNSLNHYSFGSVMEFVYSHAAGVMPLGPGFRKVRLAPKPDVRFKNINFSFDSAAGKYMSNWEINKDGSVSFHIEVPFGCEAEIVLPERDAMLVSSGSYDFDIKPKKDYSLLYSPDTRVECLLADPKAVEIIENCLPGFIGTLGKNDIEDMAKSLIDLRYMAEIFGAPTEGYDKAIEAICQIKAW